MTGTVYMLQWDCSRPGKSAGIMCSLENPSCTVQAAVTLIESLLKPYLQIFKIFHRIRSSMLDIKFIFLNSQSMFAKSSCLSVCLSPMFCKVQCPGGRQTKPARPTRPDCPVPHNIAKLVQNVSMDYKATQTRWWSALQASAAKYERAMNSRNNSL